jgi:hypothetical protein
MRSIFKHLPPERVAELRRLYETTDVLVADLAKAAGCTVGTFQSWARKLEWRRRVDRQVMEAELPAIPVTEPLPPLPPLPADLARRVDEAEPILDAEADTPADRAALIRRIERAVARQIGRLEARLDRQGLRASEQEASARALATLVRLLRELNALDAAGAETDNAETDEAPRDIDALRDALADRLERLARELEPG